MSFNFDVDDELQQLKKQTKAIRKTGYKSSRLDKYAAELLQLKRAGASTAEITRWLRSKRIKVAPSTTLRWLKKNG